ncbi:MAG: VPS10 domain-containing protein [Candidatus Promineifilaceae bacterium]
MSQTQQTLIKKAAAALKLRGIGPAVMGGRIADLAVHPNKRSTWYVAVGSGGLWKTANAGTTWDDVFRDQPSYSIGCVTIDPNNPEVIWVGTGENVSGRHVAWGDGVYRSRNGGKTWQCMGLKKSEHIGRIVVDPRDSNIIFVAAEGPLWSAGGERGLYKSADGGESWQLVLEIDADTGVNCVEFDPSNPDVVYAAAYQRRRKVWSLLSGGGGSGIWKSADNGQTWRKLTTGLPKEEMGKIGLAVTPADPSILYATIEANDKEKGFYRSTNRGESWEKRNDYISGGTGPHYYQRIFASPTNADKLYQMDVFVHCSADGGKTFNRIEDGRQKHSDNHAFWIDPNDGDHLLCGCDAGLYESYDGGKTWRHFPNLPISQFYRCAVDNAEPFYNILGGAQDLGTLYGPSRTMNIDGVRNRDWYVPMGADGYHVAFDPEDPNIFYVEWQEGNLLRYHKRSEEILDIKPMPEPNDPPERWNWDAPVIISPHAPRRLYYASQRVWRSENRGNSWTPISGDLTRNLNRYELEVDRPVASVDALYDNGAMSRYSTITNLSESPLVEGLLFVGTDDGLIQISENGGQSWRVAASLPNVPERAFINSIRASQHDANTVYAVADAHKEGDYAPYVFVSNDLGRTWRSISGDMPAGEIVWALEQDHVNADLLFLAAEFGLHFSVNGGENWHKLSGNVPTIAFRDLKLQRRDNDLVGATFGRGFYILDDYSSLREMSSKVEQPAHLFPVRDAWWYVPYEPMQSAGEPTLGATAFKGANPEFGATFTYYLKEGVHTQKEKRNKQDKLLREKSQAVAFPGYETLNSEALETNPNVMLLIRNADGEPVRRLQNSAESGLHRITWDLRTASPSRIKLTKPAWISPWESDPQGALVAPGIYSVELFTIGSDGLQSAGAAQSFTVKPVPTLEPNTDVTVVVAFQHAVIEFARKVEGVKVEIGRTTDRIKHIHAALLITPASEATLFERTQTLKQTLASIVRTISGDPVRAKLSEADSPSVIGRLWRLTHGHSNSRQMPTETQKRSLEIASADYTQAHTALKQLIETDLAALEADLTAIGAAWTPSRQL